MVSVVRRLCMFSLSLCDKMVVQDMHREREDTLVMSDVIVKGHEWPFSVEIGEKIF